MGDNSCQEVFYIFVMFGMRMAAIDSWVGILGLPNCVIIISLKKPLYSILMVSLHSYRELTKTIITK